MTAWASLLLATLRCSLSSLDDALVCNTFCSIFFPRFSCSTLMACHWMAAASVYGESLYNLLFLSVDRGRAPSCFVQTNCHLPSYLAMSIQCVAQVPRRDELRLDHLCQMSLEKTLLVATKANCGTGQSCGCYPFSPLGRVKLPGGLVLFWE